MHFKKIFVTVLITLFLAATSFAQDATVTHVKNALIRGKALANDVQLPDAENPTAEATARSAANYMESSDFKVRLDEEKARLRQVLFNGYTEDFEIPSDSEQSRFGQLPADERIYILFSESVPVETLRTYVRDLSYLDDANIVMVMRGFVGGMKKVRPTIEFIQTLLVKEKGCRTTVANQCEMFGANIDIDPLIFSKFEVNEVPAFVFVRNIRLTNPDQSLGNPGGQSDADPKTLYGDVSLNYALETFVAMTGEQYLSDMAKKLNKGFYGGK